MDHDPTDPAGAPPLGKLQSDKYKGGLGAPSNSFRLDEGYSDETKSEAGNDGPLGNGFTLPPWLLSHTEPVRADLAFALLSTLRTSTIANIVERLTPLLHMDPVQKLPPEITAEIFSYLDPTTLLTASLASRAWRDRIQDSLLWRKLYLQEGWKVNMEEVRTFQRQRAESMQSALRKVRMRRSDTEFGQPLQKRRVLPGRTNSTGSSVSMVEGDASNSAMCRPADAGGDYEMQDVGNIDNSAGCPPLDRDLPLTPYKEAFLSPALCADDPTRLNWVYLYRQRRILEDNWLNGRFKNFQLPHPLYPWEAHRECIYAIQFSGNWLVSSSRDRTLRIWNLETRRLRYPPLLGHKGSVLCLQFDASEEEDIIISGSSDRNVIIWRFSTGEKLQVLSNAHLDSVLSLRFDKRYLVTCSKDKLIKVWNRQELSPSDEDYPKYFTGVGVRYPPYIVDTSSMSPSTLEAQIANEHIKSLQPYSLLMTLDGHGAAVNSIQIDKNEIVSASGDRLIKVWDIHSGSCLKTLVGHQKGIACVQFDSKRIISGSNDLTVRIYDHASGAEVACLLAHEDLVRTLQAGFGDPPGSEETMRLEAMAVDHDYWEAQRRGDVRHETGRRRVSRMRSTGSRRPQDIMALGAKIPPGGGGSRWARIVSGSYDETIIIWKRDKEGKWVVGQRLRQTDAARASSAIDDSMATEFLTQTFGANLPGIHRHLQAATHHPQSNAFAGPSQSTAAVAPSSAQAGASSSIPQPSITAQNAFANQLLQPHSQPQSSAQVSPNAQQAPIPIPQNQATQIPTTGQVQPTALQPQPHQPQPQPQHPALQPPVGPHPTAPTQTNNPGQVPPHHHATARIFKLQFDARKLICASQDHVIVGWDFANGDKYLEEVCRFFESL
uniref:Probable E3 ubiquitin ligase complex SCF subunit sconB n=1 Tax=Coccidioides posadasii RMSCC 3488 TaxID=454284 RepID=A0A0J6F6M3_COCPO|nr:F-box/WD repeat-containing protein lin-23 [Coccidioides posadasii RMSCC 3488]